MSRRDDNALLIDILHAGENIRIFTNGMSYDDFAADKKTQFATCHQLAIIGEASGKLSDEFKKTNGQVPWSKIVGMRNHLIHAYHDINLKTVWHTVSVELPSFLQFLNEAAAKEITSLDARIFGDKTTLKKT